MITIVLDSNAIHRDPWLRSEPGVKLLDLAAQGKCRIVFPQVVLDELHRQQKEDVEKSFGDITKVTDKLRGDPVSISESQGQSQDSLDNLLKGIASSFDTLTCMEGVEVQPIPADVTAKLVECDLARRRPFLETGAKPVSTGFRDAVIWQTVLETLAETNVGDKLIFVTADKGFLTEDKKQLHRDLLDDVRAWGIDDTRITLSLNVFDALEKVNANNKHNEELVRAATAALYVLDGRELYGRMTYKDIYGGPEIEFELPSLEEPRIVAIDQNSAFIFEEQADGKVTGTAEVTLSIDGVVLKADYYMDEDIGDVDLMDDINEYYFSGSTSADVTVHVDVDVSGGEGNYKAEVVRLTE